MTEPNIQTQASLRDSEMWDVLSSYKTGITDFVKSGLDRVETLLPIAPETILSNAEDIRDNIGMALTSVSSQGVIPTLWSYTPQVLKDATYDVSSALLGERSTQVILESARAFYNAESGFGIQKVWDVVQKEFAENSQYQRQIQFVSASQSPASAKIIPQPMSHSSRRDSMALLKDIETPDAKSASQFSLMQFLQDQRQRKLESCTLPRQSQPQQMSGDEVAKPTTAQNSITPDDVDQTSIAAAPTEYSQEVLPNVVSDQTIEQPEPQQESIRPESDADAAILCSVQFLSSQPMQEIVISNAVDTVAAQSVETNFLGAQTLSLQFVDAIKQKIAQSDQTNLDQSAIKFNSVLIAPAVQNEENARSDLPAQNQNNVGAAHEELANVLSAQKILTDSQAPHAPLRLISKEFLPFVVGAVHFSGYASTLSQQQFARIILRSVLNDVLINLSNVQNQVRRQSGYTLENQLEQDLVVQAMDRDYHIVTRSLFQDQHSQNQEFQSEDELYSEDAAGRPTENTPSQTSRDVVVLTVV